MSLPQNWRRQAGRYRLQGVKCQNCGRMSLAPRTICPRCHSSDLVAYQFSGKGEVYSYSTLYQAPAGYQAYVPYTAALVRLEEGPLVAAQLTDTDPGEVQIGQKVEMVTRKLREYGEEGLIVYGYKFRPVLKGA